MKEDEAKGMNYPQFASFSPEYKPIPVNLIGFSDEEAEENQGNLIAK